MAQLPALQVDDSSRPRDREDRIMEDPHTQAAHHA